MILAQYFFRSYLEEDEKLISVFHRHPFVFLPEFFSIAFFGIAMPVFLWILFIEFWFIWAIWIVISLVRIMNIMMIWYHDVLLITSVSLMDVCWNSLFDRSTSRLEYPMIEGISCEIKGFIPTIFRYGNITVQKAGSGVPILLKDAMNPLRAEREIMEYQSKFVTHQSMKDAESLKDLITTIVRKHSSDE